MAAPSSNTAATNSVNNATSAEFGGYQYKRSFNLTVYGTNLNGLDLSALHCKGSIKRSSNMTPNCADIRIYNLDYDTALQIKKSFTRVVVQGGYDSNYGVIFRGNIKQVIIGRESATDTFIDLNCGDGDLAYNFAVVNTTLVAGSSMSDQFGQIAQPMYGLGVTQGSNQPAFQPTVLPRGKTMWGASRDYLRVFAQQNSLTWSMQNEQISFIPMQSYAKGITVVLTSKTGMIGTPQQTNIGVNVVCLMNPLINPGRKIQIDNKSVAGLKIDLGNPKDPVNLAPPLNADGVYYVLVVEQTFDNRGIDWYSKLICCTVNSSTAPINSVPVSYGP
jgi:hypothetical protein